MKPIRFVKCQNCVFVRKVSIVAKPLNVTFRTTSDCFFCIFYANKTEFYTKFSENIIFHKSNYSWNSIFAIIFYSKVFKSICLCISSGVTKQPISELVPFDGSSFDAYCLYWNSIRFTLRIIPFFSIRCISQTSYHIINHQNCVIQKKTLKQLRKFLTINWIWCFIIKIFMYFSRPQRYMSLAFRLECVYEMLVFIRH